MATQVTVNLNDVTATWQHIHGELSQQLTPFDLGAIRVGIAVPNERRWCRRLLSLGRWPPSRGLLWQFRLRLTFCAHELIEGTAPRLAYDRRLSTLKNVSGDRGRS